MMIRNVNTVEAARAELALARSAASQRDMGPIAAERAAVRLARAELGLAVARLQGRYLRCSLGWVAGCLWDDVTAEEQSERERAVLDPLDVEEGLVAILRRDVRTVREALPYALSREELAELAARVRSLPRELDRLRAKVRGWAVGKFGDDGVARLEAAARAERRRERAAARRREVR